MTPWTVTLQVPLYMGFSQQDYWSRLPFPSPGDLPDPRIEPMFLASSALADGFFTTEPPGRPNRQHRFSWEVELERQVIVNAETYMLQPPYWVKASIDREAISTGRKGNLLVLTWNLGTKKYVSVMSQEFSTKNLMPYLNLRFEFMLYTWSKGIWGETVTWKCDSRPWCHTVMNQ